MPLRVGSEGVPTSKLKKAGATKKRGTKVHFIPDKTIFTVTEYNFDTLAQRLRELAFLNKGLLITLTDEGWATFKAAVRESDMVESDVLGPLSKRQREDLASLLELLIAGLDETPQV